MSNISSSFSYGFIFAIVGATLVLFGLLVYSNYWLAISYAYNGSNVDGQPLILQDNITGKVSLTTKINVNNVTSIKAGQSAPGSIITDSKEQYLTRNYTKYINAKQQAELVKPQDYSNTIHTTKVIDVKHSKSIFMSNAEDIGGNSTNTRTSYLPVVEKGLDGLSQLCCTPPDIQLAVSSKYVMEAVNTEAAIYTKIDGHLAKEFGLESLFNLPARNSSDSHSITDPVMLFDYKNSIPNSNNNSRWFISISDITTHSIRLAVSETDDPTGVWRIYNFPFESLANNCSDQPFIGVSSDKVVISVNTWSNNCNWSENGSQSPIFRGVQFVVSDKHDLLSGAIHTRSIQSLPNTSYFSLRPAVTLSSTTTLFLVSTDDFDQNRVQILSIDGPISELHISKPMSDNIHTTDLSPDGIQPITFSKNNANINNNIKDNKLLLNTIKEKHPEYFIHTGDARVQSPIWYKGRLWFALNVGCIVKGDIHTMRSCIRIIEFNTNTSRVIQDFNIGVTGTSLYYPALSIDKSGSNMGIIFGYSSIVTYPSLLVSTSQARIESSNSSLEIAQIMKKGNANSLSTRYGDYFSAATDPSEPNSIWLAGQYHHIPLSTVWSTYIAKVDAASSRCCTS